MPRGGSKKGEHRGAARREVMAGAGKVPVVDPAAAQPKRRGRPPGKSKATLTKLRLITKEFNVSEMSGLMPKAVLLTVMRTFLQIAMAEADAINTLIGKGDIGKAGDIELFKASYERHLILAADMAYKAASYYHPRLQALAVTGHGSDQSPGDVLRAMLDEIDDESRAERVAAMKTIEHAPQPKDMN